MKATYSQHVLDFKQASGTSRGILKQKETWFIKLETHEKWGIGECGMLRGLSCDDRPDYEEKLQWICDHIGLGFDALYATYTIVQVVAFSVVSFPLFLVNKKDLLFLALG